MEADSSAPEGMEASLVSPQLPDPGHVVVCAKDVAVEAALVTPDVAGPLMAASAATPTIGVAVIGTGIALEGIEA